MMDNTTLTYQHLLNNFLRWAELGAEIRGALLVGSRSRIESQADQWADMDIILVALEPQNFLNDAAWLDDIGAYWTTHLESGLVPQRRVVFAGGMNVDFLFFADRNVRAVLEDHAAIKRVADTFSRGIEILLDKDGTLAQIMALYSADAQGEAAIPSQTKFDDVVNHFWYLSVWTAKHLRRGEFWRCQKVCNADMQGLLLRMIEWHARSQYGWKYDTWFEGRYLEHWAHPSVVAALPELFAPYDPDQMWAALFALLDLFNWLAAETAHNLNFSYSSDTSQKITTWVHSCFPNQTR